MLTLEAAGLEPVTDTEGGHPVGLECAGQIRSEVGVGVGALDGEALANAEGKLLLSCGKVDRVVVNDGETSFGEVALLLGAESAHLELNFIYHP